MVEALGRNIARACKGLAGLLLPLSAIATAKASRGNGEARHAGSTSKACLAFL